MLWVCTESKGACAEGLPRFEQGRDVLADDARRIWEDLADAVTRLVQW